MQSETLTAASKALLVYDQLVHLVGSHLELLSFSVTSSIKGGGHPAHLQQKREQAQVSAQLFFSGSDSSVCTEV